MSAAPRPETLDERFSRLLTEHGPALTRLVAANEWDVPEREDLMQDIALAIWRALPSYRGESSERTFLFRIAHNRAITHRARSMAEARVLDPREPPDVADSALDVTTVLLAAERRATLMDAVRRLTPALRETIVLHLEGLSHDEIAEVLGTNTRTVAVRLTRARAALAALLRETAPEVDEATGVTR